MKVLKELRRKKALTLREVEEITGISNPYLSQLENGKIKSPSAQILRKLALLYEVDVNELIDQLNLHF